MELFVTLQPEAQNTSRRINSDSIGDLAVNSCKKGIHLFENVRDSSIYFISVEQ